MNTPPVGRRLLGPGTAPLLLLFGFACLRGDWLSAIGIFVASTLTILGPMLVRYLLAVRAVRHLTGKHLLNQENVLALVKEIFKSSPEK